jgi:hypothetical protein
LLRETYPIWEWRGGGAAQILQSLMDDGVRLLAGGGWGIRPATSGERQLPPEFEATGATGRADPNDSPKRLN